MLLNCTVFVGLSELFVALMTMQMNTQLNSGRKASVYNRNFYQVDMGYLVQKLCPNIETLDHVVSAFI